MIMGASFVSKVTFGIIAYAYVKIVTSLGKGGRKVYSKLGFEFVVLS